MKDMRKKALSLIMVLMLTVTTVIASSCASNHPIDESKLPDLGNNTEQNTDKPEETTSGQTQAQPESQPQPEPQQQPQQEPANNQGNTNAGSGQNQTASEPLLSEDEAINIVLNKVPGAGRENLVSFGRDFDDGRWLYEGELIYNGLEYDFEIDAMTGNILEWEIDD